MDGIALRAAERGTAVLYVEQPARHARRERRVFATTAARPQPWLATVFSLEQRDDVEALFARDSVFELSPAGAEQVGRYVGLGAAPAVLGIGRP
jgi:antirestriction protein ArdC